MKSSVVEKLERHEESHKHDVFDDSKAPEISDKTDESESDESKPHDARATPGDDDNDHHDDENQKKRKRIREFISDIDERVEGTYDTMETLRDRLIHSGDCGPIEDGYIYEHDPETWQLFRDVNDAWSSFHTALDTLDSRYHALHDGWWHNRRYEKNKELNAIREENPANINKHQI